MPLPKGKAGMDTAMEEFKEGKLHSGKGGPVVKNRKQAVAIGLNASGQSKPEFARGPKQRFRKKFKTPEEVDAYANMPGHRVMV